MYFKRNQSLPIFSVFLHPMSHAGDQTKNFMNASAPSLSYIPRCQTNKCNCASKMARWIKALATKPDNLRSVPRTYMVGEKQFPEVAF